ncbi:MAG: mannonate dehydratase [Kiritimatiellae bacterium]|nr:mannonate dehydratase [Kiritimatiellia bacterium]
MKQGWRWYGTNDAISLKEIRQAGVTDVVAALYERKCGDVWPVEEIKARQEAVRNAGMEWSVVESVPVHESIKKRSAGYKKYIENYKQTMRNLAECGIKTVCYNFMPILDWTRSNLEKELPDGSTVLEYDDVAVCAFDLFLLKRKGAEKDYPADVVKRAKKEFPKWSSAKKKTVSDSILLGLPGTVDDLTIEEFREQLKAYANIDDKKLRGNLYKFLNEIAPLCQELGIKMAIHPDDPPRPIFGLPRILSTEADILEMYEKVPYENIGLTFCTGSLGGNPLNDEVRIFKAAAKRIHFVHFRNVVYSEGRTFNESPCHLSGKVDIARLMKLLIEEENRRGEQIVVRPDHGRFMEIDKNRKCYAGYSYGGRLVGLAELRGLEYALKHTDDVAGKVIVFTGATGVLGTTLVEDLLSHGAKVAICGLKLADAETAVAAMAKKGYTDALPIEMNVLDRASVEAARDAVLKKWGRVDVLVNAAGGNHPNGTSPAEQMTKDVKIEDTFFGLDMAGFEFVNKLNFIGTLIPSQVFCKVMADNGGGSVLNFCSMAAYQPMTKVAAYAAAKAGIMNFTMWLATHLAPMNIRVNALAPGFFITNQNRFLLLEKDEKTLTARGNKVINKTPMRKFGEPKDLCSATRFLLSDESSFVTGVTLPVDGGFVAYSGV